MPWPCMNQKRPPKQIMEELPDGEEEGAVPKERFVIASCGGRPEHKL